MRRVKVKLIVGMLNSDGSEAYALTEKPNYSDDLFDEVKKEKVHRIGPVVTHRGVSEAPTPGQTLSTDGLSGSKAKNWEIVSMEIVSVHRASARPPPAKNFPHTPDQARQNRLYPRAGRILGRS